ncbi:Uncharacterized protein OBRU01_20316 [Operophtera brumata]|uniref:C2H2-type domain-containing protein n=1 Tax=Operophtera brumata TaxID=104452 RepID=A0A0L7KVG5_OPEBR|nr:Uncharacterized protein OBRU01_20316 [Operophtera brumata]
MTHLRGTLLTYVTATPFRTRANRPFCFYCSQQTDFATPDELRLHTRTLHPDRTHHLEIKMRPSWKNETIKIDIKDATCSICNTRLLNWSDVLEHLKQIHNITFQSKHKMIPYILDNDKSCVICNEKFTAFVLLDAHLNKHYRNYTCEYCGEPFITAVRLKAHEKIHDTGRFPCPSCDKVFTLEKYMKKHASFVHSNDLKVKCYHCSEVFKSEHQRQAHIVISHKEHVDTITCELCGNVFSWMRKFVRHMKRAHGTEHRCNQCGTFFASKKLLLEHAVRHTGVKEFKCPICFRRYYSLPSLKSHMKYGHTEVIILVLVSDSNSKWRKWDI